MKIVRITRVGHNELPISFGYMYTVHMETLFLVLNEKIYGKLFSNSNVLAFLDDLLSSHPFPLISQFNK